MKSSSRNLLAALLTSLLLAAAPAHAALDVSLGALKCNVSGSIGFIFGSSKDVSCTFERTDGTVEKYKGSIDKYGVDIGYTKHGVIIWGVLAAHKEVPKGSLAGEFAGVSASATAGYGLGANVLVLGGDERSDTPKLALQPLSIEGNTGLNIAAGISTLTLKSVE